MRLFRAALLGLWAMAVAPSYGTELPPDPRDEAGIAWKPGAQVPLDAAFLTSTGQSRTLGDMLNGEPILLAPVDLDCSNICGVTLGGLFDAVGVLVERPSPPSFSIVAMSFDSREGPAEAAAAKAALLARFPEIPDDVPVWFVVDPHDASVRVSDSLGFHYGFEADTDQFAHPAAVAVLTADGQLSQWLYGYPFEPDEIADALAQADKGSFGSLGQRIWLMCHSYDPSTGKYTFAVERVTQAAALITFLSLGGAIGTMLLLERRRRGGRG